MKYLIIDKKQRVDINGQKYTPAILRLSEELEKLKYEYDVAFFEELEFEISNENISIKANQKDINTYTHIIFRGHSLHNPMEYEFKRYIIEYINKYNLEYKSNILVQNSKAILKFPYYNKIAMGLFCIQNNIPYFHTYFKTDGNYLNREILKEYPIIMKEYSGINRLEIIDGKEKVKKNVFKIDSIDGFKQENLSDQDHSKFFIQEFSDIGQDIRLFVQKGKVIAGWKRNNTDSFMTVSHGEYTLYNTPIDSERVLAEKVAQLLEADFMAVDIMYIHDTPHLQEISFHPGFKAYETKIEGNTINIGKAIVEGF